MNLKRSLFLFTVFAFPVMSTMAQNYKLLIGTYTTGKSEGIYVYDFDVTSGGFKYRSKATGVENPSYLALSNDRKNVYAVNETGEGRGGVTSLAYDHRSGKLEVLNKVNSMGDHPCYVEVDKNKRHVFVANYSGGNLAVFPVKADGSLGEAVQTIQHLGSGPVKDRQQKPHVHMTILSPDEHFLITNDLGTDQVTIYSYDSKASSPLKEVSTYASKPGSGPRHLTFHPKKNYAYIINELSGDISAFNYHNGKLDLIQSTSPVEGVKGKTDAADIRISPDGKFLYASYRGDLNELAIYAVEATSGKLNFVGKQKTMGTGPRNFAIDPSGKFLLVAHQKSDDIIIFSRNPETGLLTPHGNQKIEVGNPVCLVFAEVN